MRSSDPSGDKKAGQTHEVDASNKGPPATAAAVVPLNAPSGPRAMRERTPNANLPHARDRGHGRPDDRTQSTRTNGGGRPPLPAEYQAPLRARQSRSSSPKAPARRGPETAGDRSRDRGNSKDQSRDREPNERKRDSAYSKSRSARSRSRSHARSPDRKEHHRHGRHQPDSLPGDQDSGHSKHGRHYGGRKHSTHGEDEEGPKSARSRDEKAEERTRSASPDDRKSGHRSRRDRDPDKRRERDKERDRNGDREHRRRPSLRDRDYEHDHERHHAKAKSQGKDRGRERDRERGRERDRDRDRDHDHDKQHRYRGDKKPKEEPRAPADASRRDFRPPTASRVSSFEIKGASHKPTREAGEPSRRSSQAPSRAALTDPYAAERERSSRERLVAEAQRLAGMSTLAGGKRSHDDPDEGRRSRRRGRRGEVVAMEDAGERLRRGEAERESR